MIERAEVGKTRLIPEFPPIAPPKKITEGDIHIAVKDVIRKTQEERLSLTASAVVESASVTTLSRLKSLVPEKARQVLGLSVKKGTLTAGSLYLLISSACGNVENPSIISTDTPEPMPSSSPLPSFGTSFPETPTLTPIPEPTQIPRLIPTPESKIGPTVTPEPTPILTPPEPIPTHTPIIPKPTFTPKPTPEKISVPEPTPSPSPTPKSIEVPKTPEEVARIVEYRNFEWDTVNTKVGIDKEGLPVSWILSTGEEVYFDKEEIRKLREKAISSKEPEIIKIFPSSATKKGTGIVYKPSLEHPKLTELPKDVVGEEELKKRGIEIIQADNTFLYIREGAFVKGAPLEAFKNIRRKLTIVLVNFPVISSNFMQDSKYDSVRNYLHDYYIPPSEHRKQINEYISRQIASRKDNLEYIRRIAKTTNISADDFESDMTGIKAYIYMYESGIIPDKQILEVIAAEKDLLPYGTYIKEPYPIQSSPIEKMSVIFIAVGKNDITSFKSGDKILFFNQNGNFSVRDLGATPFLYDDRRPKAYQGEPNPKDFIVTEVTDPRYSYAVPAGSGYPGFALRHEIAHDELGTQRIDRDEIPNFSEYDTDMKAMEGIRSAWKKWEKSGFTDNSGYYFVFSLPEGGYILTKNPSSGSSAPI